jgi:hypothetical protein
MDGLIRKIVIGKDPKNAMAYFVGMYVGEKNRLPVTAIVFDEEYMYRFQRTRYHVYLQQQDKSQIVWKTIEEMPCIIEYDLNF